MCFSRTNSRYSKRPHTLTNVTREAHKAIEWREFDKANENGDLQGKITDTYDREGTIESKDLCKVLLRSIAKGGCARPLLTIEDFLPDPKRQGKYCFDSYQLEWVLGLQANVAYAMGAKSAGYEPPPNLDTALDEIIKMGKIDEARQRQHASDGQHERDRELYRERERAWERELSRERERA